MTGRCRDASANDQRPRSRSLLMVYGLSCLVALTGCLQNDGTRWATRGAEDSAVAMVRVGRVPQDPLDSRPNFVDREYEVYIQTQAALIRSPFILAAAIRNPPVLKAMGNMKQPLQWLEQRIQVDREGDSEVLSISLRDDQADRAVLVLNAVVDSYLAEVEIVERTAKTERLDVLRSTYRQNMTELRSLSDQITKLSGMQRLTSGQLRESQLLLSELEEARRQLLVANVEVETIQKVADESAEGGDNAKLQEWIARQEVLRTEIDSVNDRLEEMDQRKLDEKVFDTKRMELASLQESTNKIAAAISELELLLKMRPRIQLVQRAVAAK